MLDHSKEKVYRIEGVNPYVSEPYYVQNVKMNLVNLSLKNCDRFVEITSLIIQVDQLVD